MQTFIVLQLLVNLYSGFIDVGGLAQTELSENVIEKLEAYFIGHLFLFSVGGAARIT